MAKYELLYTLPAKYTEEEAKKVQDGITAELSKFAISISRNEEIGKIKLAYPMQHVRHGHYVEVDFTAEPAEIAKMNEYLRLNNAIARYQVVHPTPGAKPVVKLADPEARIERREPAAVAAAPVQAPIAAAPISQEELDKKLDALEADITKEL